jgi:hypothetical protein
VIAETFASNGPDQCSGLPVCRYEPDTFRKELGPELAIISSGRTIHLTRQNFEQPFVRVVLRSNGSIASTDRYSTTTG